MTDYFAGIDIGSTMTKVVILDDEVMASVTGPTGPEQRRLANRVMAEALEGAGLAFEDISYIVSTGYGRLNVPFADKQITEISCHAKGVAHLFPQAKTVIDIGGQDSKGIKIGRNGRPANFIMNDKCAAGSGRFLEVLADALEVEVGELGELSLKGTEPAPISNMCTVWAEQEVVSRLADGISLPDLVAGIHESLANRVVRMVNRMKVEEKVVFTGGVALNMGMVKALSDRLGHEVLVPAEPLLTGALGAALLGKDIVKKAMEQGSPPERKERSLKEVEIL
ncbi:MAG: 2-hydroxyglutaryl-CoA dehydratase [Deltaproteobacteria bacterium]|nr:2-hydroxyglutaryl-CoA dehydratase [Deltaproteobacteria bacterium]